MRIPMDRDLENSIIKQVERDGMASEREDIYYCPVCGAETDEYAYDQAGECVGCRECVSFREPWEIGR